MPRITLDDPRDFLDYQLRQDGTVEIVDIAVGTERRRGRGRKLVEALFAALDRERRVWAITRADNEVAQLWYEALQFRVVGTLRRFYSGHRYGVDAILYGRTSRGPV